MNIIRYCLVAIGGLAITVLFSSQIKALEDIRHNGQTVLLDLRPSDPRALMLGDFMALRYVEERSSDIPKNKSLSPSGQFVLPRYYFQNGTAQTFEDAEYGIFKINPSGRAILVGLADENFAKIAPPRT